MAVSGGWIANSCGDDDNDEFHSFFRDLKMDSFYMYMNVYAEIFDPNIDILGQIPLKLMMALGTKLDNKLGSELGPPLQSAIRQVLGTALRSSLGKELG